MCVEEGPAHTHLAQAACLTEGADRTHVALVAGAELGRVVRGRRVQGYTGVWAHISRRL